MSNTLAIARRELRSYFDSPIAYIVIYSFNDGRLLVAWQGASLAPYRAALSNPAILDPGTFVGSGAFVLSALSSTETTMTANSRYWAGPPARPRPPPRLETPGRCRTVPKAVWRSLRALCATPEAGRRTSARAR